MSERPELLSLADACGIYREYERADGVHVETTDETREALLFAMGFDASSEDAACRTLAELRAASEARPVAPTRVVRSDDEGAHRLQVRVPESRGGRVQWQCKIEVENGRGLEREGETACEEAVLDVEIPGPAELGPGYHKLSWRSHTNGLHQPASAHADQNLIVTPPTCMPIEEAIGDERAYGIAANLYTLKSARNLGIGDLGDLAELCRWAGRKNAAFVGINPLHAVDTSVDAASPYSPTSRLFDNPIYLDIEGIPEFAESAEARALMADDGLRRRIAETRAAGSLDYPALTEIKRGLFDALYTTFLARHGDGRSQRGKDFAGFKKRGGTALERFAAFSSLVEQLSRDAPESRDWRSWPAAFRSPHTSEVARFRNDNARDIDFHCYLQFELDRQLGACNAAAHDAGMTLGLYGDLAVGSTPGGADAWAFPELFTNGAGIGAPPDAYAADGQDWGLAPMIPTRLADSGYEYWTRLLRAACRHTRLVRLDHAVGLVRQFWVVREGGRRLGGYVSYPTEDLFGILALESRRSGTVIIAEDLGTIPSGFRELLGQRRTLRSHVLYFERGADGSFLPASNYAADALASANTHDLATLAGFWSGVDLERRRKIGLIADDAELESAREGRELERRALCARLEAEGICDAERSPDGYPQLAAAVHDFMARTPSRLVSASLDDLTGETLSVNIPASTLPEQANWCRRMKASVETLETDPDVNQALGDLPGKRSSKT